MNPISIRTRVASAGTAALAALLAACGGGAEGTGDIPVQPAASYSSGVMTLGSVIVNGVRYTDDANTQVFDDRGRTFAQLADGMVVKVRGRINADGVNGTAERVEVENELRGTVTGIDTNANPPTIAVGGVLVQTDESTVFGNVAGVGGLTPNVSVVEVHGLRTGNTIRASRVEVQNGTGLVDEFKGAIASKDTSAGTFIVGGVTVAPASTTVYAPAGCSFAALAVNQIVEVHGSFSGASGFSANRVDCEDLEDDNNGVKPPAGARNEIEGFITGFSSPDNNVTGSFTISNITVNFSSSTQIRNGARADLANGVRVEVDGTLNGTTLTAREISFKQDRIIVQGTVTAFASGQATVLGQVITVNNLTRVDINGGTTVSVGGPVEVRARLALGGGGLIAEEVRDTGGNPSREIVQARVTTNTATSITVLGIEFALPESAEYQDINDAPISRDAFLAAITANATTGTLVKLRADAGFVVAGLTATGVTKAEIEN